MWYFPKSFSDVRKACFVANIGFEELLWYRLLLLELALGDLTQMNLSDICVSFFKKFVTSPTHYQTSEIQASLRKSISKSFSGISICWWSLRWEI